MSCASCKNRTSFERCPSKCLLGSLFCGKHIKAKHLRLWAVVNNVGPKVVRIQTVWRGYAIRRWIKLAGPGAMCRKECHNEEELVTLSDKQTVSPLDYFSFKEGNKLFWFDVRSIAQFASTNSTPINPYTRQPLSFESRRRLRELCLLRHGKNILNRHSESKRTVTEAISDNCSQIGQIIEENGFFDLHPLTIMSLNRSQLFVILTMVYIDMRALAAEHTSPYSRRHKHLAWIRATLTKYHSTLDGKKYLYMVSRMMLSILNDTDSQYSVCFVIMSSLFRL